MRPNFVRREREVPLSSKIGQLIVVVSSIIVGAFIGTMVGMVIAGLCIELCVITTAEPILLIMGSYCCYRSYCSRNCSCIKANRDV